MKGLIKKDLNATFGSLSSVVGMLLSGTSLCNWSSKLFKQKYNSFFSALMESYRSVFHTIFDYLFTWWVVALWPNLNISNWHKDVAILFLIIGFSVRRALWPAYLLSLIHI